MPIVRIVGLKQEGGELFLKIFANIEGIEKANKESKRKKSSCQETNMFYYVSRKSIGCL